MHKKISENNSYVRRIIFGIGSNLGNKNQNIEDAVAIITKQLALKNVKISSIYKNPAMLPVEAPIEWNKEFFNIAMSADINIHEFSPLKILEIVKNIEKKIGRQDSARWAPREIDIDILIIENELIDIKDILKIPHEGLFKRDFFYKTVSEIEPKFLTKLY